MKELFTMKFDTKIICDICKKEIELTDKTLRTEHVTLTKDTVAANVEVTLLQCPSCGKVYPVIVDTAESAELLTKTRSAYFKRAKYLRANKKVPQRLEERYQSLNRKLDFKRQQIAEKFNGAIYQLDGDTIQLDYRYHAR